MPTIKTTLTTSGNSTAVRLPQDLLKLSGLGQNVTLEAHDGTIIIRKSADPRADWAERIRTLNAQTTDDDFSDMRVAAQDGLDDLAWDGPSFEDWQKQHDCT